MSAFPEPFEPAQFLCEYNLAVALDLARRGAYVFPCKSEGGPGVVKQPQPNVYWRSASTRNESEIIKLWTKFPKSVPAIDVGKTGLLVVDCDRKLNDGLTWLRQYAADHQFSLDSIPAVETPSSGRHHIFKNTIGHGNGRGVLPPKKEADIDIRGDGGYVIAPGAVLTDGSGDYIEHGSIFDAEEPPEWLRELLAPRRSDPIAFTVSSSPVSDTRLAAYGEVALRELASELAGKQEGERNDEANRIAFRAGQLVGGGCLTEADSRQVLEQAALSWGIHPRDKALGPKGTIARAIREGRKSPAGPDDSHVPAVVIELNALAPQAGGTRPTKELPDHLTRPPGLVGELTDWITDTALYPQRGLSLGAALTIVGTAAGRHIAGPNKCGTHLYIVGLAPSGAGKNHPLSQIATVMAAADMRQHIGPSQFISMPAVINFLCRSPLAVCAMDEFGSFLKRINNRRASGFEGAISGLLRSAWGLSFSAMATPEWAQRAAETIFSPALSIFGVSTAREFYDSLEGADVTNGVLNRFLVIETKIRPQEQVPSQEPLPQKIIDQLKDIYSSGGPLAMLCQSATSPAYRTLDISPDAEQIRRGMIMKLHKRGDADPSLEPFLARTAENAVRLATIVTIGLGVDCIEADVMAWGREFALWSTDVLAEGAGLYIADSDTQAAANAVRRAIQERGGRIGRRDLMRALAHRYKRRELEDVIAALADSETIEVQKVKPTEGGGAPATFYRLLNT